MSEQKPGSSRRQKVRDTIAAYREAPEAKPFHIEAHLPAHRFAAMPANRREKLLSAAEQLLLALLDDWDEAVPQ